MNRDQRSDMLVKSGIFLAAIALFMAAVSLEARAAERSVASALERRADAAGPHYAPGEIIVKLTDEAGILVQSTTRAQRQEATLARLQARYGVAHQRALFRRVRGDAEKPTQSRQRKRAGGGLAPTSEPADRLDLTGFHVLRTERDVPAVCVELNADRQVQIAQPNYIYHVCRTPNDPDFPDQYAHQLIEMEKAWDISTGSRDVVVAVLGTGVDVNHPDLEANIWVNEGEIPGNEIDDDENGYVDDIHGWNFGDSNNEVRPQPSDDPFGLLDDVSDHETHVAGVIAAEGDNGEGVCGVNWQCSLMALRMSLYYFSDEVAEALEYAAANGADVLNMSFGGDVFGPEGDAVVQTAIDRAYEQGVLLIASAGNSDSSRPHYPAAYPNVMAVASTNGEDLKTGHSTFGAWVDIAAPGTDIVTTDLGDGYIATAGTSFSSPYVAAVAALLFSHRPDLTHIEARAILENTTDPVRYGDVDPDLGYLGTGRVNAYQTLLNADRAYPLGEIVAPRPRQTFAADVNAVDLALFVHGDSYQLDYRLYGCTGWMTISEGGSATDPNDIDRFSIANPGVGTYELRLRVTRDGDTHTDRKLFSIALAPPQAHWPKPDQEDPDELAAEYFMGSPLCMDVDGDGTNEIIQSSLDLLSSWGGGKVHIWDADGNSLPNWPVVEFGMVLDDFLLVSDFWPTALAVGDIDGDGDYELVMGSEYDNELHAYHVESAEIVEGVWPAYFGSWYGYVSAGPVLADLDGDGDSEIIMALDAEASDSDGLYAFQGNGEPLWQRRYTSEGPISVADLDGDGDVEIALCGFGPGLDRVHTFVLDHEGRQLARWRGGSPKGTAVADLDADGTPELVSCTERGEVMAVHADGGTTWKIFVDDYLDEPGAMSIGDLDGDGYSEVYVATYIAEGDGFAFTRLYAFDHEGLVLADAGYPKAVMGVPAKSVPLIADVDGDGQKELLLAPGGEPVMAWEADGSVTPGFPLLNLASDYEVTPALGDLDGDGDLEIMALADDYRFHVLDLPAPYAPEQIDWGMSGHDPQNSRWSAPAPRLDLASAPTEIQPGQTLQVQINVSNPGNLALHWSLRNLPDGAQYDAESHTLSWEPTAEQAFQSYALSFLVSDGVRQDSRSISVTVVPDAIYCAGMNADPNWQLDEGWTWSEPTEEDVANGDPNAGHTGASAVRYSLTGGRHAQRDRDTQYATTGPIDCRGYRNVTLGFWQWLTAQAHYDDAAVQVSLDGENWQDLWTTGQSPVPPQTWQQVVCAVPNGLADDQPAVYFRWGLGSMDDGVTYLGWNIDDVQVTGDPIE
ncbi:MAG: S8 family serine peptidase [Sedimentisphaerales bacterium]|nr:S8 family serine peptidase [Sedimentisphaerales bacterium]